jgi:hypothetical protein
MVNCLMTYNYQTRVVLERLSLSRSGLLRESSLGRICHATTTKAHLVRKASPAEFGFGIWIWILDNLDLLDIGSLAPWRTNQVSAETKRRANP